MTEKKRIRPRGMEAYPESIRVKARRAFIEFSYLERMGDKSLPFRKMIEDGAHDDMPMLMAMAFVIQSNAFAEPAGVKCTGCGSQWDDERLKQERSERPALRSCCPERKTKSVFWCADE